MSSSISRSREQLADTVVRCIDANDLLKGLAACQSLNRSFPDYAYGWYLASYLMKLVSNHAGALKAIDRTLLLAPSDKYQLHKARCLFEVGDIASARAAVSPLKEKSLDTPALQGEAGSLLHLLGDYPGALQAYSRAIQLDPGNPEFHFSKAAVQRYLGDALGAEEGFNAAIALNPNEFEAYNARAQLRKQSKASNHVTELVAVIERTQGPGLTQLYYALAKELEDIGDFDNAFTNLKQGADSRRRHMQYSVDTDLGIMAKIRGVYGAELFDARIEGSHAPDPIFILGMPRTGTTLVERMLGSHSNVFAAGELNNFTLELLRLVQQMPGPPAASRLDFVERTTQLDFRALGEAYIASTRVLRDGRPFFIDKLPFNFLYAGLIHLALPKAKIINLKRHPMDTCYAVYKQLFKDAYPFSYDLNELGQYYIAYEQLMQHWNTVMPGVIHTLRYEHVVGDIEGEARRLLEFCSLPWEDQVLRFHQNPHASTTASAMQVRQPIYDTSVGKWRNYARQLEPLRAQLQSAGIDTEQG